MKYINKRYSMVVLALMATIAITYAGIRSGLLINENKKATKLAKEPKKSIDIEALKVFRQVYEQVNPYRESFELQGRLTINDGADTTANVKQLPYQYVKRDKSLYFLLGDTEMLNADGVYICVDRIQKKIMIGRQKEVVENTLMPDLNKIIEQLQDEDYQLTNEASGKIGLRKVAIINPTHITCKELALFYKEETMQPTGLFSRLSNFDEPLNPKMDKTILMTVEVANKPSYGQLMANRIIKKIGKQQYVPTPAYNDFEVVMLNEVQK